MPSPTPLTFLVDNGSLRAASWCNLKQVAGELSRRLGQPVRPASLLHSSKIPVEDLGGEAASTLIPAMREAHEMGHRSFQIMPFFLGPSAAIRQYLPERLQYLRGRFGDFDLRIADFLCGSGPEVEPFLIEMLADRVRHAMRDHQLGCPPVILVDHGSPLAEVAAVRNQAARQLAASLGSAVASVVPASMERREGAAYAFNDPLLAWQLEQPGYGDRPVVVALFFLSPGRHAGELGDIAMICREAEMNHLRSQVVRTSLLGDHEMMPELLLKRWHTMISQPLRSVDHWLPT